MTSTDAPAGTVSGVVTDGGGHGWPLYALIDIAGYAGSPIFTDPVTGAYSVALDPGTSYDFTVTAIAPGYAGQTRTIVGPATTETDDFALGLQSCFGPAYALGTPALSQTFDSTGVPAGWSVINNTAAGGWQFDDPHPRGNLTGGTGGFAIIDSDFLGIGNHEDTYLVSPVVDLSALTAPRLTFNQDYRALSSVADVDLSIDGGATWTTILGQDLLDSRGPQLVDLPIPQAGGQSAVQFRFHYTGTWAWWWEVDNVSVAECHPQPAGLVVGGRSTPSPSPSAIPNPPASWWGTCSSPPRPASWGRP
jgi:hypothetical protein